MKCCSVSCKRPSLSACQAPEMDFDDHGLTPTGKKCGLKMCESHTKRINGKAYCEWHYSHPLETK